MNSNIVWWFWNIVDYSTPWLPTNITHGEIHKKIEWKTPKEALWIVNSILWEIHPKVKDTIMKEITLFGEILSKQRKNQA